MESRKAQLNRIAPRRIRAQAAVWVTELHGPDRNPGLEEKVRRWIAADPRHAAAFELATEAWQRSGNLPAHIPQQTLAAASSRSRSRLLGASLAGAAVLCGLLVAAAYYLPGRTLVTSAAEQRTVELADGTQVTLNANTRVRLQYDDRLRKVTLSRGEAFFHVAKLASKPFVVVAGNRKVIALGTSFLVRCEDPGNSAFAVTLVEGRVAVEPMGGPDLMPNDSAVGEASLPTPGIGADAAYKASPLELNLKVLNPGERIRFAGDAPGVVDAPSIDKVTAWQRGLLIFDDTTLAAAAAEFNRYGSIKISLKGAAADLRVSGVYGIGETASFAQAMSLAHHLNVDNRGAEIILSDEERGSK
jgi:transmembrane sensor